MNRRLLAAALAAALFAVTACGGSDDAGTAASPAVAVDSAPRSVEGAFGTVDLEGEYTRVAATGNYESDIALALGVRPIIMGHWLEVEDGSPPWRRPLLEQAGGEWPKHFPYNPDGYDVEQTLAEEPDLVLDSFLVEDEYEQLSKVVPTVSLPYELSTEEFTLRIGRALGLEKQAQALVDQTEAAIAAKRAEHPAFEGKTVAYGYAVEDGTIMDYTDKATLSLLTQLGFTPSPTLDDVEDFSSLGPEQYAKFDVDLTIVTYPSAQVQQKIEGSALFQRVPAVAEGRYWGITDPDSSELLRSFSPPQISYALQNWVPELAKHVK